jgi:hypothetical protein
MESIDTSTATEARMLWASLRRQPDGMSDVALTQLWAPTWSHKRVRELLDELVRAGLVRTRTGGHPVTNRYFACEVATSVRQQGAA